MVRHIFERPIVFGLLGAICLGALGVGCSSGGSSSGKEKVIVVPSSAATAPPYRGDGSPSDRRYVVRMSDGSRDWEVEFPETANGYQLRIPLNDGKKDVDVQGQPLTRADKELLESRRRQNVGLEREGIYADGQNLADDERRNQVGGLRPGAELDNPDAGSGDVDPWAGSEDRPAPTRRSYFLGIEEVQKLYHAGRYEMAVVFLKDLDEDYPEDPKIMAMMGTLYLKLNQEELAREYWERVLQIDPTNQAVIDALKQLNQRGISSSPAGGGSTAPTTGSEAPPAP